MSSEMLPLPLMKSQTNTPPIFSSVSRRNARKNELILVIVLLHSTVRMCIFNQKFTLFTAISRFSIERPYELYVSEFYTACTWTEMLSLQNPDGVSKSWITSLIQCFTECLNSAGSCAFGLDWIETAPKGQQCLFSTTSTLSSTGWSIHYNWTCLPGITWLAHISCRVMDSELNDHVEWWTLSSMIMESDGSSSQLSYGVTVSELTAHVEKWTPSS